LDCHAKAAFDKIQTLFTIKLDLILRKNLVKCYVWNIALYGSESGTLRKVEQKYIESFELRCWGRMEKIIWADRVRKEMFKVFGRTGISYINRKKKC